MAAQEMQVLSATASDVASDMAYHRESWLRFINIMKWTAVGSAVILVVLFFIFN